MLVNVKIDKDDLLDMLSDRLDYWDFALGDDEMNLFLQMYEDRIDGGCFDGMQINIRSIVDNDVNGLSVIYANTLSKMDYTKFKEAFASGERDVSCESFVGYIEAYDANNDIFLVSH